ncbi:MAG TPA: AAA family ATPase [Polyangium sp.]|nr:AAA family ATPase [Polyangium sp.]
MIERVSFTNFKSLRKAEIALGRFMVIVGPNGSGKTSILDGLHYLAQAAQMPLPSILKGVFGPLNLISRDAQGQMKLMLSGRFQGVDAGIQVVITRDEAGVSPAWGATVVQRWGEDEELTADTSEQSDATTAVQAITMLLKPSALARALGSARKLRLDVESLAAPSYSDEETPRLGIDGEGLASVLADLAGRSPETLQSIQDAAHQVVPTLERIRTRRAKVARHEQQEIRIDDKPITHTTERPYWGQQLVLDFKGAPDIPAPLASEGTLLVIGLLTALWTEPRPRLLLLDDIDKALHPRAQEELVAQLRKVLAMDPELQIIATSHSPYLLDHFKPEEVLVTALRPDGSTACAPLTEHPDFERWKNTTRTGELWSFVGEDWVTKQANDATARP